MWKKIRIFVLVFAATLPLGARGDVFGGDVAVLSQILSENVQQLIQLKSILQNGQGTLSLLQEVNRGINDSLQMAQTLGIRIDPGIYRNLGTVDQAIQVIGQIYGTPVDSPLATVQRDTDQTVAEAISFNNSLNEYANNLDQIGEEIKAYSHSVSPGGAAKLSAESMGVLIHVADQQLRATGQGLKLQAQAMAMQNKHEKDQTEEYLNESAALRDKMTSLNADFNVPRF